MLKCGVERGHISYHDIYDPSEAVKRACRQCCAGSLACCDCEVKFHCLRPLLPPAQDMGKFWVVRGPSSDHSGLGSTPKLNFAMIFNPACAADTETEVLVACGTPERGFPPLVEHVSILGGWVFLQILVVLGCNKPHRGYCQWWLGNIQGGVVPHPAYEGCLTLLGACFAAVDCCTVVANELQTEFIYKHVEGAKSVAVTTVAPVGIHDDVCVVQGPNEELHELQQNF